MKFNDRLCVLFLLKDGDIIIFKLMWKLRVKKEDKARNKLMRLIGEYNNWGNDVDEDTNQKAKEKLLEFYEELKTYEPSKYYELSGCSHLSYLTQIIKIADALEDKLYLRVCNELEFLICFEPIFQNRIYCNLIHVFEKHFKIHSDDI